MSNRAKKRLAIIVDMAKCFDCKACMVACKVENKVPDGYWRNWVKNNRRGVGLATQFQPGQCMQCEDPSCVAACPVGATFKRADGIVVINPRKCIGCGNCVTACPYGARYRDPATRTADKCDFCAHRLAEGEQPACVETCPTKARVFGDLNDSDSEVSRLAKAGGLATVPSPQVCTGPNIYYLNGKDLFNWAVAPTLPGGVHMPPEFWKI